MTPPPDPAAGPPGHPSHPRVEQRVEQVDDQVGRDDDRGAEHDDALSTSGMSWVLTAVAVSRPRPAREKTVSVTTVPARNCPTSRPTMVNAGRDALRAACRRWTRSREAPLARAVST